MDLFGHMASVLFLLHLNISFNLKKHIFFPQKVIYHKMLSIIVPAQQTSTQRSLTHALYIYIQTYKIDFPVRLTVQQLTCQHSPEFD